MHLQRIWCLTLFRKFGCLVVDRWCCELSQLWNTKSRIRSLTVLMRRVPKINKATSVLVSVGTSRELHCMEMAPFAGASRRSRVAICHFCWFLMQWNRDCCLLCCVVRSPSGTCILSSLVVSAEFVRFHAMTRLQCRW